MMPWYEKVFDICNTQSHIILKIQAFKYKSIHNQNSWLSLTQTRSIWIGILNLSIALSTYTNTIVFVSSNVLSSFEHI